MDDDFFSHATTLNLAGAEIPVFDPFSDQAFITSSIGLQFLDLREPIANLNQIMTLVLTASPFNLNANGVTSVDVCDGLIAFAVPDQVSTNDGNVVFINAQGSVKQVVQVGPLPDMVKFSPDCQTLLAVN